MYKTVVPAKRNVPRIKKHVPFLVLLTLSIFFPCTCPAGEDLERAREARYDINYASYLIEVGKYMEALENYETAIELTSIPSIRIDALLAKATLLSSFLDAPEEALKVYRQVYRDYPKAAEIARYREGLLLFQLNRPDRAREALEGYLIRYPRGRFRFQAEALIEQIKKIPPPPPEVKPLEKAPLVRVRLCKTRKSLLVKGDPVCAEGFGCREDFTVRLQGGRIFINGSPAEGRQVVFQGKSPLGIVCGKKKKRIRGKLMAKVKGDRLYLINLVDMEDYLKSVVPSESYSSWPLQTLKAQAVASRTYAYYQLLHRKDWDYDLVDDQGDQAYKGIERERPRSTRAVNETRGMVLTYENRPILAMYSANSGGYTADAMSVFSLSKPYLIAHPDPESLKGKMARWTRKFTVKEVEAALKRRGIKVNGLKRIEAEEKGPSGRIVKVRVVSRSGSKVLRTRTTLRRALKLPEILLDIERTGDRFIFRGRGWGHGVGYSQWGSAILGKTTTYDKILRFYYPNATLTKKW
ncbi:MAG: SpoIID/LytB domain-containing protein [Deltaproteobacteria bacterium]|nr:SpoIID/LytB domain-containing protein [Deltaproteobacteria bacterium]MBW2109854.1 SpoIID/LytB domain-containing protein [Deltaproteobacteria bacterium]